jgi:UDP-N-acetyl-2-amino-2-deoxyglucuronate dehydrogenase
MSSDPAGEPFRFGIVGCGIIGPLHAEALYGLPDAQLIAVADAVPERAQALAAQYHATPYTDLQQMLVRENLDIVNICTPSGLHCEHACQVMRSGRHVIVEKPMALSREEIATMLYVQRESGVKLAVISQHRFDLASLQVHGLIAEGAFGTLVLGNAQTPWWRSQAYYDHDPWRGSRALDGGVLMNQAIHAIDLLQWFMGPVARVYAYTATRIHRMEAEDVAVGVLYFTNGALGTISATTGAYPGMSTRIELFGNQGSAVIDNDRLMFLYLARDERETVGPYGISAQAPAPNQSGTVAAQPNRLLADAHQRQIADFIRAIREDGTPLVDGEAGRRPVEIILALYESAETGREVTLQ